MIVITDFDGTLHVKNTISKKNIKALFALQNQGITTVIATGRSIKTLEIDIKEKFPIDYVIFSSGIGIIEWATKETIFKTYLHKKIVSDTIKMLLDYQSNFMLHEAVPYNHKFYFYQGIYTPEDFFSRIKLYPKFAKQYHKEQKISDSTQLLVFFSSRYDKTFLRIKKELDLLPINTIVTTSPIDNKSIWLEIFPQNISKSQSSQWLCNFLKLDKKLSLAIGNDFNDFDLLKWSNQSFIVSNAPKELLTQFPVVNNADGNGFFRCIKEVFPCLKL